MVTINTTVHLLAKIVSHQGGSDQDPLFHYRFATTAKSTSFAPLSRHDFLVDKCITLCYLILQD